MGGLSEEEGEETLVSKTFTPGFVCHPFVCSFVRHPFVCSFVHSFIRLSIQQTFLKPLFHSRPCAGDITMNKTQFWLCSWLQSLQDRLVIKSITVLCDKAVAGWGYKETWELRGGASTPG